MLIFFLEPCLGTPGIIPSMLYYIGKCLNFIKMVVDISLRHHQTAIADLFQIHCVKAAFPVKWNIAAFHHQILSVFDGSFDHLPHNGP